MSAVTEVRQEFVADDRDREYRLGERPVRRLSREDALALTETAKRQHREVEETLSALAETLLTIDEGEGWKALGYGSFSAWFEGEFGRSRQRGSQLLTWARMRRDLSLSTRVNTSGLTERQARELSRVSPEDRGRVLEVASRRAPNGIETVSARTLRAVAAEVTGKPATPRPTKSPGALAQARPAVQILADRQTPVDHTFALQAAVAQIDREALREDVRTRSAKDRRELLECLERVGKDLYALKRLVRKEMRAAADGKPTWIEGQQALRV
jgi:hypothetical protein